MIDVILFIVAQVVLVVFCFKIGQAHGEALGVKRSYDHFKELHKKEDKHVSEAPTVVVL